MLSVVRFGAAPARIALSGLVLAALVACGSSLEPATPPKDVTPATIGALSTDTLRAVTGSAVGSALTVTVKNAAGTPIDSAVVTFAVISGGGSLSATSVRTNSSGQAGTTWTLGSAVGTQTVTASAGTLAPVTFIAIATAGPAATIAKLAGDAQTGVVNTNLPILPSVKITDRLGNPVAGQLVTFTTGASGGTITGGAVNTGADGVATVAGWRLGAGVGAYTVIATAGSLTTTFAATAIAGAPAVLTVTPAGPFALDAGQTVSIAARVTDAAGNLLATAPVTYVSANQAVASIATNGTITANGAGVVTITAASGAAFATVTVSVTGHPVGTAIASSQIFSSTLGDVAVTNTTIAVALPGALQLGFLEPDASAMQGAPLQLGAGIQFLLGGAKSTGPLLAISAGTTSRVYFIDQMSHAVLDSLDVGEIVTGAVINSTGTRAFLALGNGEMAVVDVASRSLRSRISLGGGTSSPKVKIDRGDTLVYVLTNVGIMFEIDARTSTTRQIILPNNAPITDFEVSRDGTRIFTLDGVNGFIRVYNASNFALVRFSGISGGGTSIAVSPDDAQVWITHGGSGLVTWYTGSIATGFTPTGSLTLASMPLRVYFNQTGSFAAIAEQSGTVDIIR